MTTAVCTTDKTFKKDVLKSNKPVVVDFGAVWCGPCKKLSPIIDEVAKEMTDKINVFKIDADENPETTKKYKVVYLPTLLIFKNGKLVDREEGFMSKKKLTGWINENC
jgi:thioredoxin 1